MYLIIAVGLLIYFGLLIIVMRAPMHRLDPKVVDYEDEELNKIVIID